MYTREQEKESIQKTVAAFEKVMGQKPTGYLSPGHASTPHTLELVAEAGIVWWADPLNSDPSSPRGERLWWFRTMFRAATTILRTARVERPEIFCRSRRTSSMHGGIFMAVSG
jgi:peptidoglycan/xylan/chitin deacetylase (PgdA/CDA1 family)